tara:strand:- start:101 stop:400 length:300 start_codon:yes stop_codon:yes gene_type:complete
MFVIEKRWPDSRTNNIVQYTIETYEPLGDSFQKELMDLVKKHTLQEPPKIVDSSENIYEMLGEFREWVRKWDDKTYLLNPGNSRDFSEFLSRKYKVEKR